jgi:hypothetical protein
LTGQDQAVPYAVPTQDCLLDLDALCVRLSITKNAAYNLTRARLQHSETRLPVIRIGRTILVRESSLNRWLDELEKLPPRPYKPRRKNKTRKTA